MIAVTHLFGSSSVGKQAQVSGGCIVGNYVHIGDGSLLGMGSVAPRSNSRRLDCLWVPCQAYAGKVRITIEGAVRMKILVIAAHPDDEVYGMGGTIAKRSEEGDEVHVLIVTDGCTAQYRNDSRLPQILAQKQEEARRANALLGVKSVHFGTLPDMRLDTVPHVEVNQLIEETVDAVAPEVVYTHFSWGRESGPPDGVPLHSGGGAPGAGTDGAGTLLLPGALLHGVEPRSLPTRRFCPILWWTSLIMLPGRRRLCWPIRRRPAPIPIPSSAQYVRETDRACGLQWGMGNSEAFILLRQIR